MSWASITSNQLVSRANLQDAVTTGVFSLRPGQTIPAGSRWVTRSQVEAWLFATVSTGTSNRYPRKSWISPISTIFTVNFHNQATGIVVTQVHGITGYLPSWTYPINAGQTRTTTDWPLANWGPSCGLYGNTTSGTIQAYTETWVNGVLIEAQDPFTFATTTTHLAFGSDAPAGGDVMDIYLKLA